MKAKPLFGCIYPSSLDNSCQHWPEFGLSSGLVTGLLDNEVVHHKAMVIAKLH